MNNRLSSFLLALVFGALLLGGCAGEQKKAAAPPPPPPEPVVEKKVKALKPVKVKVTAAKEAGATGPMQPVVEITGEGPKGWKFKAKEKREGTEVKLTVFAHAPEGAEKKPEDAPFTIKHKMKLDKGAWSVRVFDNRGIEIKRIDYNY